jgi:predicted alpha/beta superfamily hydrolase
MTSIVLAALLLAQAPAPALSAAPALQTVLLDGRCDGAEWRGASRTALTPSSDLLLQQTASHIYLCVTLPADSYGTMDLYVWSPDHEYPTNLHASAQVGERVRTAAGWPDWSFGNQQGWYSPPVALSRATVVDGRARLTFGAVAAREVAIEKAKFGSGPWRVLLEVRALGADKNGTLTYPPAGTVDQPASWAQLEIGTPAGAPVGTMILQIASRALSETREVWIDAPAACTTQAPCDVLYVLDAHALFPLATAYATVMNRMGRMQPLIVVGIPSRSPDDRVRNFTDGAGADERRRFPSAGGAAAFTAFLNGEVAPAIAARYQTSRRQVLAGHSLAGLYAAGQMDANAPFERVIAISPTLGWNDQRVVTSIEQRLRAAAATRRELYVSISDGDADAYQRGFDRLRAVAEAAPGSWLAATFDRRAGEDHVTTVAPALQRAMRQFFVK